MSCHQNAEQTNRIKQLISSLRDTADTEQQTNVSTIILVYLFGISCFFFIIIGGVGLSP
jgi:hypothetical protein